MSRAQLTSTVEQNTGGAVSPYVAGKNAIINGGMDIWQRGTSFAVTSSAITFTADRWYCITGNGTATYSQESSVVPTNSGYAMKMLATSSTQPFAGTVIETQNSLPFVGKTVTVSVQVAATTSTPMQLGVQYSTTVDETPTGATWVTVTPSSGGTATPTSTTYIPLTGVYAIPSTAKTLKVYYSPTSNIANTVALYATRFQLEVGSVATTFTRAGGTLSGELAACQRYYAKSYNLDTFAGTATNTGSNSMQTGSVVDTGILGLVRFPVSMRVAPTVTFYSRLGTINRADNLAGTDYGNNSAVALQANQNNVVVQNTSGATLVNSYNGVGFHYIASAEL